MGTGGQGPVKPQAVSKAAVGWACLGFGGSFVVTGGLVLRMFFIGGRGPPLQVFRLDHPVLPVVVPMMVIGVVLFIVGLRLQRGERGVARTDERSARARAKAWRGAWGALAIVAAFYGLLWTVSELMARARAEDLRRELAAAGYSEVRIARLGPFTGRCGRGSVPYRWMATQGGGYACGHWIYPLEIEAEPDW